MDVLSFKLLNKRPQKGLIVIKRSTVFALTSFSRWFSEVHDVLSSPSAGLISWGV